LLLLLLLLLGLGLLLLGLGLRLRCWRDDRPSSWRGGHGYRRWWYTCRIIRRSLLRWCSIRSWHLHVWLRLGHRYGGWYTSSLRIIRARIALGSI
jgi:hypothetical protein